MTGRFEDGLEADTLGGDVEEETAAHVQSFLGMGRSHGKDLLPEAVPQQPYSHPLEESGFGDSLEGPFPMESAITLDEGRLERLQARREQEREVRRIAQSARRGRVEAEYNAEWKRQWREHRLPRSVPVAGGGAAPVRSTYGQAGDIGRLSSVTVGGAGASSSSSRQQTMEKPLSSSSSSTVPKTFAWKRSHASSASLEQQRHEDEEKAEQNKHRREEEELRHQQRPWTALHGQRRRNEADEEAKEERWRGDYGRAPQERSHFDEPPQAVGGPQRGGREWELGPQQPPKDTEDIFFNYQVEQKLKSDKILAEIAAAHRQRMAEGAASGETAKLKAKSVEEEAAEEDAWDDCYGNFFASLSGPRSRR